MPSITFKENGLAALQLYQLTETLTGDEGSVRARQDVRKRILAAWPELEEQYTDPDEETARRAKLEELRDVEISPSQQTALAEGFLKIIQDSKRTDGEKTPYFLFAKKCKFSQWLDRQMDKRAPKEFTEADEEAVAPDAEAIPAPIAEPEPIQAAHG